MSVGTSRPNILIIVTDQHRYDALGANLAAGASRFDASKLPASDANAVRAAGHLPGARDWPRTPHLDRLAAQGMRFERAYTTIGICTPARASLLTGRYPHNHGMLNNAHERDSVLPELPETEVTWSELLAAAGYRLGYVGKWHVGRTRGPETRGFHDTPLVTSLARATAPAEPGAARRVDSSDETATRAQRAVVEPADAVYAKFPHGRMVIAGTASGSVEQSHTYRLAEAAIGLLRDYAPQARDPFALRLDFPGPHHPHIVPEPFASMYPATEIPEWGNFRDTFAGKPHAHAKHVRYRGVDHFTWEMWQRVVAKYFGFVTMIDQQIGRVLAALEELGLANSTIVCYTTDHGDFTGSHRQFNKGPLGYLEVYHVPLIVRWPGRVQPGRVCREHVVTLDLAPTVLAWAGVGHPSPERLDGRSLVPLLEGRPPADWPQEAVSEYHGEEYGLYSQRIVHTERYKLVYNCWDLSELYDLQEDPFELRNLYVEPGLADVRRDLEGRLLAWMQQTNDQFFRWSQRMLG